MTPPDPLGVAIAGTGFMARVHARAVGAVAGACDTPRVPVVRRVFGRRDAGDSVWGLPEWRSARPTVRWADVLDDDEVEVVIVATANEAHADLAVSALRAGKHVLCEKPAGGDLAGARLIAAEARAATGLCGVAFNYRFLPGIAAMKQELETHGPPTAARAWFLQQWGLHPPAGWRGDPGHPGTGVTADVGSHVFDALAHLTDLPVAQVHSALVTRNPAGQDELAMILLELGDGVPCVVDLGRARWGHTTDFGVEVTTTDGMVGFELGAPNQITVVRAGRRLAIDVNSVVEDPSQFPAGHWRGWDAAAERQLAAFVRAVCDGDGYEPGMDAAVAAAEIADEVLREATPLARA